MQDGELIATWEPGPPAYVLVLTFKDDADMYLAQERLTQQHCGWEDDGTRKDAMETVFMAQGVVGKRELMDGQVTSLLAVASTAGLKEAERLRQAWAHERMMSVAPRLRKLALSEGWQPTEEAMDWVDKWCETVLAVDPAGVELSKRRKTGWLRDGFNAFVEDNGRPDLKFVGSAGGRAFSAIIQNRYGADVEVRYQSSNAYFHGLIMRPEARLEWFLGRRNA